MDGAARDLAGLNPSVQSQLIGGVLDCETVGVVAQVLMHLRTAANLVELCMVEPDAARGLLRAASSQSGAATLLLDTWRESGRQADSPSATLNLGLDLLPFRPINTGRHSARRRAAG